jgi:hypothetical protein
MGFWAAVLVDLGLKALYISCAYVFHLVYDQLRPVAPLHLESALHDYCPRFPGPRAPAPEPFGVHLMIDGKDTTGPLRTDPAALRALLDTLPAEIGMHALCAPVVVSVGPIATRLRAGCRGS